MQRHYIIQGRVQGVFFRDSTRQRARELGLDGWVRNRPDGSVEAVAQGPAPALAELEQWFRDGGPPAARVDDWTATDAPEEALSGFRVR